VARKPRPCRAGRLTFPPPLSFFGQGRYAWPHEDAQRSLCSHRRRPLPAWPSSSAWRRFSPFIKTPEELEVDLAADSKRLRREREKAFYGEIDFVPGKSYDEAACQPPGFCARADFRGMKV